MDGYNTIVDIINEGLLPERYEEWKRYPRTPARGIERFINWEKYNGKLPKILFDNYYNNAKQGLYFDDNIDMASYYPTIITDLMKGT